MVRRCFTIPDVKIPGGNNRQIDLLAIRLAPRTSYHVETAVTHQLEWQPTLNNLIDLVNYKFFGAPRQRDLANPRTDAARGKTYFENIESTYSSLGISTEEVLRVVCCWVIPDVEAEYQVWERSAAHKFLFEQFELLSFRDQVIPKLQEAIGRSNYDDEILRTFSLLAQYEKQTSRILLVKVCN